VPNLLQPYIYVNQSTRTGLHIDNILHTANSKGVIGHFSASVNPLHKGVSSKVTH
jgi:hypothetical protein